jgi:hypothetical protein
MYSHALLEAISLTAPTASTGTDFTHIPSTMTHMPLAPYNRLPSRRKLANYLDLSDDVRVVATPAPQPTATVTETVAVTPPAPVIHVQVPAEPFDLWKDIIFNDFGGAFLGVLGAATVAWWLTRREREARLDERRRDQTAQLSTGLRNLCHATSEANPEVVVPALEVVAGAAAPLLARVKKAPHADFQHWLAAQMALLPTTWFEELQATKRLEAQGRANKRRELARQIIRLQVTVERWGVDPKGWRPATTDDNLPRTVGGRPRKGPRR